MNRLPIASIVLALFASSAASLAGPPEDEKIRYDDGPQVVNGVAPEFVLDARTWGNPGQLKFSFRNYSADLTQIQIETALANALSQWAAACPFLNFAKIGDNLAVHDAAGALPPAAGDLRILFGPAAHGDFAFSPSTLAHAFYPPPNGTTAAGDTHFNDDFTWGFPGAPGGGSPYDLQTVALHEFGHALGLAHSADPTAVMAPIYGGPLNIQNDDVLGIRAKYCPLGPMTVPVDLMFVFDLTGSFSDDLPNVQASIAAVITSVTTTYPNLRTGLASFRDFPFSPWGNGGDFTYKVDIPLAAGNGAAIQTAVQGFVAGGGADFPEAQYEALFQMATGAGRNLNADGDFTDPGEVAPSQIPWGAGRLHLIYMLTDADFHDADTENYPCGGTGVPIPCSNAAGRNATIAALKAIEAHVIVMIAQNPPDLDPQGSKDFPISPNVIPIASAAAELATATRGAYYPIGTSSQYFSLAVMAGIQVMNQQNPGQLVHDIPTLPEYGLAALVLLVIGASVFVLRRRNGM